MLGNTIRIIVALFVSMFVCSLLVFPLFFVWWGFFVGGFV